MKKVIFLFISLFLLLSVVNIAIGLMFWIKNVNRRPLEIHVDAPYTYYQNNYPLQFERGKLTPVATQKPANEIRILLLGGSVAANIGNMQFTQRTFNANSSDNYLQEILQKQIPSKRIKVINGAVAAYVTEQEFIALQKFMQYYQPDIVVALHGFNDVESFRLNHRTDDSKFIPSPIFYAGSWNSPIFKIVDNHKKKYTPAGIFEGYYNHISKAYHFSLSQLNISKPPSFDTAGINGELISLYAHAHANIVTDLYDFCRVKNFKYLNILQPARFYRQNDSNYYSPNKTPISNALSKMYYDIEILLKDRTYHVSLTSLDPDKLNYTDECHTNYDGYKLMADSMAGHVVKMLKN